MICFTYLHAHFPNVVGAINGTIIPMSGDDEPNVICRKGSPSINVQGVVDADLQLAIYIDFWIHYSKNEFNY